MHSSGLVFLQKTGNGTVISQRVKQLHFGVSKVDKNHGHSMVRQRDRLADLGPQNVPVKGPGLLQVRHSYSHMVQLPQAPHSVRHPRRGLRGGQSPDRWNRSLESGEKP